MPAHILVLEDDSAVQDLLVEILTEDGYRVTAWAARPATVAPIGALAPDLIILDYVLGRRDPEPHLWQELVAGAATRTIPLLICTAAVERIAALAAELAAAQVAVVLKPFDLDGLLTTVSAVLAAAPASERRA
jgi:CheY-like chemotaxis protein